MQPSMTIKSIVGLVLFVLVGLTVLFGSWYTVDQGERVVVTRNGEVVDEAGPGLHFKMPIMDSATSFEVLTKKYKEPGKVAIYSKDIQPAEVVMAINYHVDPSKVREIYSTLGVSFEDRIIAPNMLRSTKEVFGKYVATDIIGQRDKLAADITTDLEKALTPKGIILEAVQIENIDFSDAFEKSVEARMQAEVQVKTAEQNLRTIEVQAQQTVATAKGQSESAKTVADGEAYRISTVAKAQAEAIRSQGDALRSNPLFVELTKANKWDGRLPTTMLPNGATPLLDMRAPKE